MEACVGIADQYGSINILHNADSQLLIDFQTFAVAYFATGLVTAALQLEHSRTTSSLFLRQTALEAQRRINFEKRFTKLIETGRKYPRSGKKRLS